MLYTRKILNEDEIARVRELRKTVEFVDGVATLSGNQTDIEKAHQMKWCLNHDADSEEAKAIGEIVFAGIDRDVDFLNTTAACNSGFPIISRTQTGMYYRPHNDDYVTGEYSTTVFLSDPDEYKGGYLRLNIGGNIEEIKLPIGHAITYSTGIAHEVTEVTSGTRDVAVFWTKSKYRDPSKRYVYSQILKAKYSVDPGETYPTSLEEYTSHPFHILNTLINEYQRIYPPDMM